MSDTENDGDGRRRGRRAREAVERARERVGDAVDRARDRAGDAVDRARDAAGRVREAAGDALQAVGERFQTATTRLHVMTYPTSDAGFVFPEASDPALMAREDLGVAFSGGGTRSASHTVGQLRGMVESGLIDVVRYIGSNSGGTWGVLPFTYLPAGAGTDQSYLGPTLAPADLDAATLNATDIGNLGPAGSAICSADMILSTLMASAVSGLLAGTGKAIKLPFFNIKLAADDIDEIYGRALRDLFLNPVGLGGQQYPAWNTDQIGETVVRNASVRPRNGLGEDDFVAVTRPRPFLCVSACMNQDYWKVPNPGQDSEPAAFTGLLNWEYVEFTSWYSGIHRHARGKAGLNVGGGYVENIGWDTLAPVARSSDVIAVSPGADLHRLTLGDIMSASGAAPAYVTQYAVDAARFLRFLVPPGARVRLRGAALPRPRVIDLFGARGISGALADLLDIFPRYRYWPVRFTGKPVTVERPFGDGGYVDSFGLIPLLKRGVGRIVVFVNTADPIVVDAERPGGVAIDTTFNSLFGVPVTTGFNIMDPGALMSGAFRIGDENGQVFAADDFLPTVQDLGLTARLAAIPLANPQSPIEGPITQEDVDENLALPDDDDGQDYIGKVHGVAYCRRTYSVLPNAFYGIVGGTEVEILWVYTTPSAPWRQALHPEARQILENAMNDPEETSVLAAFPHLPTFLTGRPDRQDAPVPERIREGFGRLREDGWRTTAQSMADLVEPIDLEPVHFHLLASYANWALNRLRGEIDALRDG